MTTKEQSRGKKVGKKAFIVLGLAFAMVCSSCSNEMAQPEIPDKVFDSTNHITAHVKVQADRLKDSIISVNERDVENIKNAIDTMSKTVMGAEVLTDLPDDVAISIQPLENGSYAQHLYRNDRHYMLFDSSFIEKNDATDLAVALYHYSRVCVQKNDEFMHGEIRGKEKKDLRILQEADSYARDLCFHYEMYKKNPDTYPIDKMEKNGLVGFSDYIQRADQYYDEFLVSGKSHSDALASAKRKAGAESLLSMLDERGYSVKNQQIQGYPEGWPSVSNPNTNSEEEILKTYSEDYRILVDKACKYFHGYVDNADLFGKEYSGLSQQVILRGRSR